MFFTYTNFRGKKIMRPFNIYFKYDFGPRSFESVLADREEDAIAQFKKMYPDRIIVEVTKPRPGAR